MATDERAGWVTTAELLDAAHRAGFTEVTERRLETWRNQKLLPRPERVGQHGLRPRWLSPPGTVDVLLELCELRDGSRRYRRIADNASLRLRRWLHGDDLSVGDVRAALLTVLDDIHRVIDAELAAIARREHLDGDPTQVRDTAMAHLARQVASSRRLHELLPRARSLSGASRERCLHAVLHTFHTGQALPVDVGVDLHHALGLRPVRGAAPLRDHLPSADRVHREAIDLNLLADISSRPALRQAVETASSDQLLLARQTAGPFIPTLTWLSRAISAAYDTEGHGLPGFRLLSHRPRHRYRDAVIVALTLSLQQSDLRDEFARAVESISETATVIKNFLVIATGPGRSSSAITLEPWMNRVVEELARPDPSDDSSSGTR